MKKIIIFIITALQIATSAYAESALSILCQLSGPGKKGMYYQSVISSSEIEKMPAWIPEETQPPLDINEAIKKAKTYSKESFLSFSNPIVVGVSLVSFGRTSFNKDKWYYSVNIMNPITDDQSKANESDFTNKGDFITIPVMMDGSVPELQEQKRYSEEMQTNSRSMPARGSRPTEK